MQSKATLLQYRPMRSSAMRVGCSIIMLGCILLLTQCMSYDFSRRIVQQGNLLQRSAVERLKLGMSKDDVAILMGTSLLSPTFNDDRWDYAYTWRKGSGATLVRNLSLYFVHGRLARIEHLSEPSSH
jgi:outer membrane protein assembly factor BamE